jgi:copper chaperone
MERSTLDIGGMSCGHCVKAVQDALAGVDGVQVEGVEIGTARVAYDPAAVSAERIAAAVEEEGYEVRGVRSGG